MKDFISGSDCPEGAKHEEANVQLLAKWFVAVGYSPDQLQVHPQYRLRKSKNSIRRELAVDIAVFTDERRTDDTLILIAEVKKTPHDPYDLGLDQLRRYLDKTSAVAGVWFDGNSLDFVFHIRDAVKTMTALQEAPPLADNFAHYVFLKRSRRFSEDKRYSIRQVAGRIGIEPSYLSKIERGEMPPPSDKVIAALAHELNEDPDILMAKAGRMPKGLEAALLLRPEVLVPMIRSVQEAPDSTLLEIARKVRDGKW